MKKIITGLFVFAMVFSFSSMNIEKANALTSNQTAPSYNLGNETLRNGSKGEAARELQRFLNDTLNMGLVLDGVIGPKTISVIKEWQRERGLVADGLIGPKTKVKILEDGVSNISEAKVCCEIYGLGSMMIKTPSSYEMKTRSQCVPEIGIVGGGRNIVDNSFCAADNVIAQPNTQKFTGKLTVLDSNLGTTKMWGTHQLTVKESIDCLNNQDCLTDVYSKSYLLSANNSVEVLRDLKLYENKEVVILGKLSFYNLEGGFEGIVVNNVRPLVTTSDTPSIDKISGPQSLNVGEKGTWVINATNSSGSNLSYIASWGDSGCLGGPGIDCRPIDGIPPQKSNVFTHHYSNAGKYNPTFSVISSNGKSATASLDVNVTNLVTDPDLSYSISTDKSTYTSNEKIKITISAKNTSTTTKTLNWSNGCQVAYVIGNYDSSSGMICTQATTSINIPPNTVNVWIIEHDPKNAGYTLPDGQHVITGKILGYGNTSTTISIVHLDPIEQPSITVLSPNGGETFKKGSSTYAGDFLPYKSRFYSEKIGNTNNYITQSNNINDWKNQKYYWMNSGDGWSAGSHVDSGSSQLSITSNIVPGSYYWLSTWTSKDGLDFMYDFSDSYFKIDSSEISTPSITVLSPNGGETIVLGKKYEISFNVYNTTNSKKVNLSLKDESINCPVGIVGCWSGFGIGSVGISDDVLNQKISYKWDTSLNMFGSAGPNTQPVRVGSKYKILACFDDNHICDFSDSYFKITSFNNDEIIMPQGVNDQDLECGELSLTLKRGMEDPQVKCLQKMLKQKGFNIKGIPTGSETNFFGSRTLEAVKAFQAQNGLVSDGVFGPSSYSVLKKMVQ